MTKETLLDVRGLSLSIDTDEGTLEALSDITFTLERGETFALVGESGCGKSLTAASLMRLLPENARVTAGEIRLGGRELLSLTEREMREVRGAKIAMVFQESSTALDPVMTVGDQLVEMIRAHRAVSAVEARKEASEWLDRVGVSLGGDALSRYPHELSGGQKQRVMIAMALSARPDIVIADEPTTALDVTLQAQILKLLKDLQKETGLTLLLITHDLAVVKQTADRLALMYAGEIVETATVADFFSSPRHPYAGALLNALPDTDRKKTLHPIEGTVPTLAPPPAGCRFRARCPRATEACARHPDLTEGPHPVRCFFPGESLAESTEDSLCADLRENRPPVLEIANLTVTYGSRRWWRPDAAKPAVRGVSLTLAEGETLALVGESGSGKTTAVMAALGLLGPKARVTGSVRLLGRDVLGASGENLRLLRRTAQIIFQDPFSSLDPRMTVRETLEEGMIALHPEWSSEERLERAPRMVFRGALRTGTEIASRNGIARKRGRASSPRLLGRTAPAHRHRPGALGRAAAHRLRRTHVGPRRLRAGADFESPVAPAKELRFELPLHHAQLRRRSARCRPHRRHARGRNRRGGRGGSNLLRPADGLHEEPSCRHSTSLRRV